MISLAIKDDTVNEEQRLSEISHRIKEIKSNGPVGSYEQAKELALLAMEKKTLVNEVGATG